MDDTRKPLPVVVRYLLLVLAVVCLVIGVVALFVPGIPTTVFILIAGWAAARSSPRFHDWLINHRHFGPMLRDWRAHGAVSRRAKILATVMMTGSAVIFFMVSPRRWVAELLTALMALVLMWLWLRPEPPPKVQEP
ncbi:inner membrane protein [Steroidobacter agaridevorans]|uniref:Inner membrane protein n=1 Tax=Steroidobacter agaridevorans TaxID=2695856 RepID=A0A829YKY2_9GAMM|nr:YbaN family protein [Steroidobacter agaridevorans]GFE84027.1 inner membrane protein [Steroidobacter agaridevorans]GFE91478.1 inner membrane protein [Steroidobacter agaridevorans]